MPLFQVLLQNASRAPSPAVCVASSCANITACCSTSIPQNQSSIQPAPASFTPGPPYSTTTKSAQTISFGQHSPTQTVVDTMLESGMAPLPAIGFPSTSISRPGSPSFTLNVPPHHIQITHDFTDVNLNNPPLPDSVCPYPAVDVSKIKVQEIKNPDKPRGRENRFVDSFFKIFLTPELINSFLPTPVSLGINIAAVSDVLYNVAFYFDPIDRYSLFV